MDGLALDLADIVARHFDAARPVLIETASQVAGRSLQEPPRAKIEAITSTHFGITLSDPYAWLRADDWQSAVTDPARLPAPIRDYLEAENAYAAALMADVAPLEQTLFEEVKGRTNENEPSPPEPHGPFEYYVRFVAGAQHLIACRRPRGSTIEEVLVDGNALARGHDFFAFGGVAHSPDHRLMAYSADHEGSERYTIVVRDLSSGKDLSDAIEGTSGSITWAPDGQSFFYVALDAAVRPQRVMRHSIGTDHASDTVIFAESDSGFLVAASDTLSGTHLVITTGGNETNEVRLLDLTVPRAEPVTLAPRTPGVRSFVTESNSTIYILTNSDGAEDFKIQTAPAATFADRTTWRELVAHEPGRVITEIAAFGNHLVRMEQRNGLPRIVVRQFADGQEHDIAFSEPAYDLSISPGFEFATDRLRFTYASMTTPFQTFDYDMETRKRVLRQAQIVPSGHIPSAYVTVRVEVPAHDGERIPLTLLYKKGTALDGKAPVLLEGYGAYGSSSVPDFDVTRLSLVDRGFIWAIAHVRGGLEGGMRWYRLGRGPDKQNTFRDFVSVARYLGDTRIARRDGIVAYGASAGGLLVGAVANQAPELFRGIIADVPFVDVLNTMLDDSLPLTPQEYPEWGDPAASRPEFEAISAYSPYDNVRAQSYPNLLVLSSLSDTRVTYWEPAKWVAKLRANKTDQNLLLLETEMNAGHGGASGQYHQLRRSAHIAAFVLKIMQSARN